MIQKLFTPVRLGSFFEEHELHQAQIGKKIIINQGEEIDTSETDIAIFSIQESRGSFMNSGSANGAEIIRKHLYVLTAESHYRLLDAGDLIIGETVEETYQNLRFAMEFFLSQRIIPIIIGGSQDNTIGQYKGYEFLGQAVNLAVIDERIDMHDLHDAVPAQSWLMDVISYEPKYLFNYIGIACQGHYVPQQLFETIDELFFDVCRLGKLNENFQFAEPEVRDADLISFDISSIKGADAPGHPQVSPNGITSEQACQLMKYAGMSDKVSSLGLYEYNPMFDNHELTAQLIAQLIWYFTEGYYNRKHDYPIVDERHFTRYIVNLEGNSYDLTFWKSNKSGRWWMEVPFKVDSKFERHQLVPCSYDDYLEAAGNTLPDKWMKVFHKLQK
ncbi:MAG: formimidoylglutamase [Bacteroidetes bacterium]|nr:formimidoylglutamase [Bacteroidota bacterium]MBP7399011.1 formimidoylglutamase [Chitinophagales bacterium]MBK7107659.1 formimidoylglutamase [Bacteroidota bacterium]MBK8486911.1 formimidoylglutamase [Bacteroidota bacterium]MBK8681192.1 formimidoylglutamase [Bacteroidota bacterium]